MTPPKGGAHMFKVLLFAPQLEPAGTTILMTNVTDGWASLQDLAAQELRGFQIKIISSEENALYPINSFAVWEDGKIIRSVIASRDSDKWRFWQNGVVQAFEDERPYRANRIEDRLTRGIMIRYLRTLGYDLENPKFWQASGEAIYFEELAKFDPRTIAH